MTAISSQFEPRNGGPNHGGPRNEGKVFGFPLKGFGLFSSLLLSFSSAILTFCVTTTVAIFVLLAIRIGGNRAVDFAVSYRNVGFPAAVVVLAVALPFFLALWVRAKFLNK